MEFDKVSKEIIGAAIEVHKALGPGLLESAYEKCLVYEIAQKGLSFERQKGIPVIYKEVFIDCGYRLDLLVENKIIVELKTVEFLNAVHQAQILTYMKFAGIRTGLLINFNVTILKNGLQRFVM